MKQVKTRDSSITVLNERLQEHYHSVSAGALKEALIKFVQPCSLKEGAIVLDVGFGLGYTALMALHTTKSIKIVALENDEAILEEISKITLDDAALEESYKKIRQAAKQLYYKDNDVEIRVIFGDALDTIKTLNEKFDAVFFDPFSPKKQPELWTGQFFADIKSVMKKGAVLTTYSCATHVRNKLRSLGFNVLDGPVLGRKSPGTIAIL